MVRKCRKGQGRERKKERRGVGEKAGRSQEPKAFAYLIELCSSSSSSRSYEYSTLYSMVVAWKEYY